MNDREKYPSELAERFQIRLPPGLRDQIRDRAEQNRRSMNAEIIAQLEAGFSADAVPATPPNEVERLQSELAQQQAVSEALRFNLQILAEQLAGPVGQNREEVLRLLSALRILGKQVPE